MWGQVRPDAKPQVEAVADPKLGRFRRALLAADSFAFSVTAEGKALCSADVYRLCAGDIPNLSKITSCMIAKKAQLSAPCRAYLDKQIAARSGKVATND